MLTGERKAAPGANPPVAYWIPTSRAGQIGAAPGKTARTCTVGVGQHPLGRVKRGMFRVVFAGQAKHRCDVPVGRADNGCDPLRVSCLCPHDGLARCFRAPIRNFCSVAGSACRRYSWRCGSPSIHERPARPCVRPSRPARVDHPGIRTGVRQSRRRSAVTRPGD